MQYLGIFLFLCLAFARAGGELEDVGVASTADSLYAKALRLEVLCMYEEALSTMQAALMLDPSRKSLSTSLQRISSLGQCKRYNPFCPPDGNQNGEQDLTVQSVSYGLCGVLVQADEAHTVGVMFTRDSPHALRTVAKVPEEIDEVVELGCERGGERAGKHWHTLRISVAGLEEEALLSWIEGDDPFVVSRLFLKFNDMDDDNLLRTLYATIVRRNAALQNQTLSTNTPPWDIPEEHSDGFTMGGRVEVKKHYVDESSPQSRGNYDFGSYKKSRQDIERLVTLAQSRGTNYYGETDAFLYKALETLPGGGLRDKHVVVMGSLEPWYEAVCVAFEAASCTTIEYNKLEYDHPKIWTYTAEEYYHHTSPRPTFDVAFSISSFEHDGLGRYGDAIDPDGDLRAMHDMRSVLKDGGLLLLAVPVGKDLLKWNAHRKYGRLRLPLLFQNWTLLGQSGLTLEILDDVRPDTHTQPIWILQNTPARNDGALDWSLIASKQ